MSIITTSGKLIFDPKVFTKKHEQQSVWKKTAIVFLDEDITRFYSWFLKKRFNLELLEPIRKTHLTIINDRESEIKNWDKVKEKYNNTEITLQYDTDIRGNGEHWWLRAFSKDAEEIRKELTLTPTPFYNFHITIGLTNSKTQFHSDYILRQLIRFNL